MGRTYDWGVNPFQDYLFTLMLNDVDIGDVEYENDFYGAFIRMLNYLLRNENDSQHLDFEIRKKDGYFKVVAKNAITAFWLSGIFPRDPEVVMKTNEYVIDNIKYKYNKKTKKLTQKIIEN